MEQILNLTYASSLTDLDELNSSFDKGILRIAYTGKNRNGSSISKQAFENCIRTMYNCPVVCNYDRETDTLGGHDMEVVRASDGGLRVVNVTEPVGCIPESARFWWDTVEEEDGTVHEYLFTEAVLWKRQEAYRKIKKDGITAQSMEITVRDGKTVDGVFEINDFEFTAFCLIGVEPCYESASIQLFSASDFKQQMAEMMQELKESFTMVDHSKEVNNKKEKEILTEGGEKVLHEKTELAARYGIDPETLDFSLDEFTLEELTEKFEAMKAEAAPDAVEAAEETFAEEAETAEFAAGQTEEGAAAEEADEPETDSFALMSNVMQELTASLESVTVEREWGTCPRYWFVDCDLDASEVYCMDSEDWLLYGFGFSMDGDHVIVDFESRKRMKYVIAEFDEGSSEQAMSNVFSRMEDLERDNAQWAVKYQSASDTIASMENELGELRRFRADTEHAALEAARAEVFARFEDLVGVEAFDELRENCESYSDMNALEEKCFAIRGRVGTPAKFSHEEKAPKLKVVHEDDTKKEPYGGIFAHFGIEAE